MPAVVGAVVGASIAPPLVAFWMPSGSADELPVTGLPLFGNGTNLPSLTCMNQPHDVFDAWPRPSRLTSTG